MLVLPRQQPTPTGSLTTKARPRSRSDNTASGQAHSPAEELARLRAGNQRLLQAEEEW
ncbi:hypothetical protein [Streptomyces sp. NPDC006285]|uniref:hypothetical protein n=1 Tax=Streptomyces sp. NPDC006285 TaxID=3364742 RepID=UPI0036B6128C